nr:hypothetical protein [uncultured organism]
MEGCGRKAFVLGPRVPQLALRLHQRSALRLAREAYFLEFAKVLAGVARMPVMTTGGISRPEVAERVLTSGVAVAGIATAMAEVPDLPLQWRAGKAPAVLPPAVNWKDKTMVAVATMDQLQSARMTKRYRAWLRQVTLQ